MVHYNPQPWTFDIVSKAQHHLSFLKTVDSIPRLHEFTHLKNAARRYELFWLQVLRKSCGGNVEPPIDIHWMWHCHLLCPKAYAKDCENLIGTIPTHEHRICRNKYEDATRRAQSFWEAMFPGEPFHVDLNAEADPAGDTHVSGLSYNLVAAAQRQKCFYYNVSLPHYMDIFFLRSAAQRYARFLNLKKKHPDEFVVPMYDVDLMWHTHQLYPHEYRDDMHRLLGYVLNHDDSATDRSLGSKLATSDLSTRTLWKETYGEEFATPGAMYRGESPIGKLFIGECQELLINAPLEGTIEVEQLTLRGCKDKHKVKALFELDSPGLGFSRVTLKARKGPTISWKPESLGLRAIRFNVKKTPSVYVKFKRTDGLRSIFGSILFKECIDLKPALQGVQPVKEGTQKTLRVQLRKFTVELKLNLSNLQLDYLPLSIRWGKFADYTMPETIEQLWGPIKLPRLPNGVQNTCRVASHALQLDGQTIYTVRVIHSLLLRMSVVQVFYKDKMTVCSELLNSQQLPGADQVGLPKNCPNLDGSKGERGMLIKNGKGDWAVITGHWQSFKRGSQQGHLFVRVMCLQEPSSKRSAEFQLMAGQPGSNIKSRAELISSLKGSLFGKEGVKFSVAEDKVEIGGDCTEVAEMLTVVFSAAVLLLLCEPKPQVFLNKGKPHKPLATKGSRPGRKTRVTNSYDTYFIPFFQNCGYMEEMCCNNWLYWHHHHYRQRQQQQQRPSRYLEDLWYDVDYYSDTNSDNQREIHCDDHFHSNCEGHDHHRNDCINHQNLHDCGDVNRSDDHGTGYDHCDSHDGHEHDLDNWDGHDIDNDLDLPHCPWDPDFVLDHTNDAVLADTDLNLDAGGIEESGFDTSAVCGGCGADAGECGAACGGDGGACGATCGGDMGGGCGANCGADGGGYDMDDGMWDGESEGFGGESAGCGGDDSAGCGGDSGGDGGD